MDCLRETNYPLPAYSTIMKKMQLFRIFKPVIVMLQHKFELADPKKKFCIFSFDKMAISKQKSYDRSRKQFFGYVTLSANDETSATEPAEKLSIKEIVQTNDGNIVNEPPAKN